MNIEVRTEARALFHGLWMAGAGALAILLVAGCTTGEGGSGGGGAGTGGGGTGGTASTTTSSSSNETDLPACNALPAFDVSVGFHETGKPAPLLGPANPGYEVMVSGTVTDVQSGSSFDACEKGGSGSKGASVTLADPDGKSWTACLSAPDASMPVQVGDAVDVSFAASWGEYTPSSFALRIRRGAALALYASDNGGGLWPEELDVSRGEQICYHVDPIDTCEFRGYQAIASAGGETALIDPGTTGVVGGFEIHLGEFLEITDGGGCDAGGSNFEMFVVPAAAL